MNLDISKEKRIYFIGIGGSSMSSLAEIMFRRGYSVSGSDMQESHYTEHLSSRHSLLYRTKKKKISSMPPRTLS